MARADILASMARVHVLAAEIEQRLPAAAVQNAELRADLAGLLAVLTCASYESCVKLILNEYAVYHHQMFGLYVESRYDKINSRISLNDLFGYCKTFNPQINEKFKRELGERKRIIERRLQTDIEAAYGQLLRWRHDFAHSGARVTTIEEVLRTHTFAKRVILCLDEAFSAFKTRNTRGSRRRAR